jgi:hypothetical protein
MEYLAERMCSLCYERAWYAKLGGCIAIKFLVERMAMRWVYEHLFLFLTALLFVMMDLTGEVHIFQTHNSQKLGKQHCSVKVGSPLLFLFPLPSPLPPYIGES